MPRNIEEVLEWAKQNRHYIYKDGSGLKASWGGRCESFINNGGGFNETFENATIAGDKSGPLNPSWKEAPRGAIHYWGGGDGHDAFELGGGALLMASSQTNTKGVSLGDALGIIHFTDYNLYNYRGWTMRHGTETLATITPIGDEEIKPYIVSDGKAVYLCVPGQKMIHIKTPLALQAIRRMLAGNEGFTFAEVQAIEGVWELIKG